MIQKEIMVFCMIGLIIVSGFWVVGFAIQDFDTPSENTVTIKDMLNREIKIPQDINKIVGLEAGTLRLLVYMNVSDLVVGVEDIEARDSRPYKYAHPELGDLPSIGPIHGGDPELITIRNPDVIFWTSTTIGDANNLQDQTGIPVIALKYGDLDNNRQTFYDALKLVGNVLNRDNRAEEVITYINSLITELGNRTLSIQEMDKRSCYIGGVNYRGAHGITSTEPDYAPFGFLNAKNVAAELEVEHAFIDPEQIIEWQPEIIFIDEGGYDLVINDLQNETALYHTLDAVHNDELYCVLPYNYYNTNFGTVLANAYYIGTVLYPSAFSDVDPVVNANAIYQELVGASVYDEMAEEFGGFKPLQLGV